MSKISISVRSGARIHFGLWEICTEEVGAFGGIGMMVEQPELQVTGYGLRSRSIKSLACEPGTLRRCLDLVDRWTTLQEHRPIVFPEYLEVKAEAMLHTGLGGGTQLACALVAVLEACNRCEEILAPEGQAVPVRDLIAAPDGVQWLIQQTGRGLRSWIGSAGFLRGGLIWDEGCSEPLAASQREAAIRRPHAIAASRPFPKDWRVVLVTPTAGRSIHGKVECDVFRELGGKRNPHQQTMRQLASAAIEAASRQSFSGFCNALNEYMHLAGQLFAPFQGGVYNGAVVERAVQLCGDCGLDGVGQSSWGPTVFGFSADPVHAQRCAEYLHRETGWPTHCTVVLSDGARLEATQLSPVL